MPTEIEQIEDLIITTLKTGVPELGLVDSWPDKMDLDTLLEETLTTPALYVIFAGTKFGEKKMIGGADNSNDEQTLRMTLVVESVSSRQDGTRGAYGIIEAIMGSSTTEGLLKGKKLTPLRGFLWPVSVDLIAVKNTYYAYGLELVRKTY